MAFDIKAWRENLNDQLRDWRRRMKRAGVDSLYFFLASAALWPAISAYQQGDLAAFAALVQLLAGVGGNLLANVVQQFKDEKTGAQVLTETATAVPEFQAALDKALAALEVMPQAQAALAIKERDWFVDTLRAELAQLGNLNRYQAVLGEGVIVQGDEAVVATEGGIAARGDVGVAVTGDRSIVVIAAETAATFLQGLTIDTAVDLEAATRRYLQHLLEKYQFMDFKGMGMADRVPLRLPLVQMYVPLKARIELPDGETWSRELRLAGRLVTDEEAEAIGTRLSEPQPVLSLLKEYDGLVILGDPGAGKTTFLKYLALRLALGEGDNLNIGMRLPILLPLSAYANALAKRDVPLSDFLHQYYQVLGIDLPMGPLLLTALEAGRALVLLDGLDEVQTITQRSLVVDRVIDFFRFHRAKGNKFVLTSRIVGYKEVRAVTAGLGECTLVDFDDEEIRQFVTQWTAALEQAVRGTSAATAVEAAAEKTELLTAVDQNPGVRRLAANPLLLTILALMKRQGVVLPERRVELYEKYVQTLIRHWNLARGLDRRYARDLDVVETVRVLAPLALWMHQTSPGVGLVKREDMRRELARICQQRAFPDPEQAAARFLKDARSHANLLLERGRGTYGFIHLTFQEYLAAVAIAQLGQSDLQPVIAELAAHVGDDNWHEVTLLAIGYLGIIQQRDEAAGAVLLGLMKAAPGKPGEAVVLAGEAVLDTWPGGVTANCRQQVVQALHDILIDMAQVDVPQRATAGVGLARLGDPRPAVLDVDEMPFCFVQAGPFLMGSGGEDAQAEDREKPLHEVDIPYDYWLGQYPVTQAQFGVFVQAGGYKEPAFWPEAAADGYWQNGSFRDRQTPYEFGEPFDLPNHPVVGISWYEALAFTRWLDRRWREKGWLPAGWRAMLPSEAEWEKAARGGLEIPKEPLATTLPQRVIGASVLVNLRPNPLPQRLFPWGSGINPNQANYDETGINSTSAVGCFDSVESAYGCLELSGNSYDWTRSVLQDYPYDAQDGRENLGAGRNNPRVLRGGSTGSYSRWLRCAFRYGYLPLLDLWYNGMRLVVSPFPPLASGPSDL